jgi:catechol 2,3-dioxygenase-like lactoylglutathione lyase family enzyme
MISHVFIGVGQFEPAFQFYSAVTQVLGLQIKFADHEKPWARWVCADGPRPLLLIGHPFNGAPFSGGNGQMVALLAPSRSAIEGADAAALADGGRCEGGAGPAPRIPCQLLRRLLQRSRRQ